jgi:hypothetical protein
MGNRLTQSSNKDTTAKLELTVCKGSTQNWKGYNSNTMTKMNLTANWIA